ncbi:hypothetical protein GCWU000324_00508 [Kingella oralis ATCC 51147]|uniref:Uncharacterized protein n=1 Tax=Kingella oralis ATCC 51147 TaxID=629741 RepID=C4GI16_9NEIS|nr:hypothetical protein GCWU000324_00508 [Kingella oralis ATCC 51147]
MGLPMRLLCPPHRIRRGDVLVVGMIFLKFYTNQLKKNKKVNWKQNTKI